ncbi:MAG: CYTH domain-containing protein [Mobilitalea sp.]
MEIERKYQIKQIPGDLTQYGYKIIEQGYLCHNPTIRIRKSNEEYILTYKSRIAPKNQEGAPNINNEVELPLTEEAYCKLKEKTEGNIIHKIRYLIPLESGLTAELDVFDDKLKGLVFVEVEFPNEEMAYEFIAPDWFGKELSMDKRFSNYHLSKLSGIEELA